MIQGALFDLDGVIADTSVYHFQAWRALIQTNFHKKLPDELEQRTKGVSRADSLQAILDFLQIDVPQKQFEQLMIEKNQLYLQSLEQLQPKDTLPGIVALLEALQAQKIKIALASASRNAPTILAKLQLTDYFAAIADPAQVQAGKPAPDIFLAAAQGIAVAPKDCIGIEDSIAGIQAINAAQAFSVGVGSAQELGAADLLVDDTSQLKLDIIQTQFAKHIQN
ncbi:beta-phosphoglucomutase [Bombilactobacillus folatiphilus]|uniref:Beta-phosphoglucomutase n=1 Tax=Bombilactobacillus folatiphilus TaxID=2923362 RepID=A0ABY4P9J6_9LACO|nr:beta-phosphoglucomutase [Bombilactobacillus folatiphilus]UQS82285.1 beta-phosphoglucomutase [Bombilactobacillus folatiphilus]